MDISVFPNPATDLIAVQVNALVTDQFKVELIDIRGKLISETTIRPGSTIAYFDVQTVYEGVYLVRISNGESQSTKRVVIVKD